MRLGTRSAWSTWGSAGCPCIFFHRLGTSYTIIKFDNLAKIPKTMVSIVRASGGLPSPSEFRGFIPQTQKRRFLSNRVGLKPNPAWSGFRQGGDFLQNHQSLTPLAGNLSSNPFFPWKPNGSPPTQTFEKHLPFLFQAEPAIRKQKLPCKEICLVGCQK